MSYSSMFGSHHMPGRVWRPKIEVSQDNVGQVPPEELTVDPYLPAVGIDPFDPAGVVVIPSGRFVSIGFTGGRGSTNYRFTRTDTGKTTLTLHDGKNLTPVGLSVNQMYKANSEFMSDSNTVKFRKSFVAETPFVQSINEANGVMYAGDKVTGYWGSTTSTTQVSNLHRGKPVKWVAKKVYSQTGSASAVHALAAATLPGITPRIVQAYGSGGTSLYATATGTLSFSGSTGPWLATFAGAGSSNVTEVVYEYGQDADQIAGEVLRIQSLADILNRDDFLRWVEYSPIDYLNFPPAMQKYPVTQVGTGSTPDTNSDWETLTVSNGVATTAHANLSTFYPVIIAFKGTLVNMEGVSTTYTDWYNLPTNGLNDARGYFNGVYHSINWRTGVVTFASNITTFTAVRILYSYITDPREGAVAWGAGITNLTDGRNVAVPAGRSTAAGTPSHLNIADVIAALRIIVA